MIICVSSEIAFLESRISELEALRDKENNYLERNALDILISNYLIDLEILLHCSEVKNENLFN